MSGRRRGRTAFAGQLPLAVRVTLHFDNALRLRYSAGRCIPRNADGISSASDSVGLVQESLTAVLCHNRRMRTAADSWQTDHRDSVHGIRVDSRDSRAVFFLPTNYANERESKSALRFGHSVQAGLPNSLFRSPNCRAFRWVAGTGATNGSEAPENARRSSTGPSFASLSSDPATLP